MHTIPAEEYLNEAISYLNNTQKELNFNVNTINIHLMSLWNINKFTKEGKAINREIGRKFAKLVREHEIKNTIIVINSGKNNKRFYHKSN